MADLCPLLEILSSNATKFQCMLEYKDNLAINLTAPQPNLLVSEGYLVCRHWQIHGKSLVSEDVQGPRQLEGVQSHSSLWCCRLEEPGVHQWRGTGNSHRRL